MKISSINAIVQASRTTSDKSGDKNPNKITTFNGLSKRMSNKIYNGFYDMSVLFPREKTKNPICGKLPTYMKQKISRVTSNYQDATKEIFQTFSEVSDELRAFEPTVNSTMEEMKNRRNNSTVEKLTKVLQKYNILSKWDDFDLRYIDKGGKGSVWKLEGLKDLSKDNEDEFVIKVFHTKSIQQNSYHGCYPEINAATYWMKTFGFNTNRGKFYWGDVHDAYMINKYIDEDVRLPKSFPNPYDWGIKFTDEDAVHIHNVCKKYSYDWGGGVVINQVVNSNRFARELMHDIQKRDGDNYRLHQWNKRYHWKPNGNYDSKYAGLALSIKYLSPNARVICFEKCLEKPGKYANRAMAYTLKYLPYDIAVKNYEFFAKKAKDNVLKEILYNEIPLLSIKDEYAHLVKDDLIRIDNISKEYFDKYIDKNKFDKYRAIAKQYYLSSAKV